MQVTFHRIVRGFSQSQILFPHLKPYLIYHAMAFNVKSPEHIIKDVKNYITSTDIAILVYI